MIGILDKRMRLFKVFTDKKQVAVYVGVHPSTIARWLPYYEDSNFVIGECNIVKSGKGTNNLKR